MNYRISALEMMNKDLVLVKRTQLIAVLQLRFIAEGMRDDEALAAARKAAMTMTTEPFPPVKKQD